MHLIYLDESGNSGLNLNNAQQPVFVLCALVVDESRWQGLDAELQETIARQFPTGIPKGFEVHGTDLRSGHGFFEGVPVPERIEFRNKWLSIAPRHGVKIVYRAIEKHRYAGWLRLSMGGGVLINPHIAAFPLVAKVVNDYLKELRPSQLGMFIFDENREITVDVENSIRLLRGNAGTIQLGQIVEKGFFIDSAKSLPIQLADVCALTLRKHVEADRKLAPLKPIDAGAYDLIEPLIHRGDESFTDIMAWLTNEEKKKRPGK
ncbi:MAG TPA: DUF3800 domain-containing protein [Tepidisphaeraceae bacterium]|jgi:hypothetical protein|nr:DUF3800 domain-containing protein [Tepidisphaeraceae bacterium]